MLYLTLAGEVKTRCIQKESLSTNHWLTMISNIYSQSNLNLGGPTTSIDGNQAPHSLFLHTILENYPANTCCFASLPCPHMTSFKFLIIIISKQQNHPIKKWQRI